ncbi:triosephosphate isomerase [Gregarina niphandrodes]|uniref:Triosephosphate isomerase n=1 Tax=Gregarina niphandrodes TaxID=110365 RepID=A0A023B9D5_GRENI|nr:triosephosphate isomerase [Gregarina niphandrodes]EZG72708.1 triosephosphate isomerase [Gregarina niphandrodes]|eukprot:XP_011129766.1 triosephosphate isomerase [Gregarina niphandrodes]
MARTAWVGGNWKCNGTTESIKTLGEVFNGTSFDKKKLNVVIFPTAIHYSTARQALNEQYELGSQNVSKTKNGAFTGEVSAEMLKNMNVPWTLVGHSERRTLYHETDADTAVKTKIALEHGIEVCLCIGETLEEREAEKTNEVCSRQIDACVEAISDWNKVVIAYEPVWAIGTGKVASQQQAQDAHEAIRAHIAKKVSQEVADKVRIVYGGSVSDANCEGLIQMKDIDGFLVGGASLKPAFVDIIKAVKAARA